MLLVAGLIIALLIQGPAGGPRDQSAYPAQPQPEGRALPPAVLTPSGQLERSEVAAHPPAATPRVGEGEHGPTPEPNPPGVEQAQRMAELIVRYDCIDPLRTALKLAPMAEQVADASQITSHPLPPDPIGSLFLEISPGWQIA